MMTMMDGYLDLLDRRRNNMLAGILQPRLHQVEGLEQYRTEGARERTGQERFEHRVVLWTRRKPITVC